MEIKTIVQFDNKEVDLSNLEKDIKKTIKNKGLAQKEILNVYTYIKPEATYVVAEGYDGNLIEFKLYEE